MSKKFLASLLAVAVFVSGCGEKKEADVQQKPVVKIGATLPLSGDIAFAGVSAQKGIQKALADIKKEKNLKYDYQLLFESDKMDAKQGYLNAVRLKSIENVQAILSMWLVSPVLTDWANDNAVIHVGCSWGYKTAKGLYNFNVCTFPDEQSKLFIKELQKRNVKKIGIVHNATQTHEEIVQYLIPELGKNGIDVAFESKMQAAEREYRIEIQKMKAKDAQVLLVLMVSPGMEIFAKQVKEAGYQIPLTSFDNFTHSPQYFEGQWYIADAAGAAGFLDDFEKTEGIKAQSCTPNLYDGLRLIVEGFESASSVDGQLPSNEDVAKAILNMTEIKSALGNVYMDKDGNVHAEPSLKKIENGKPVAVEE